MSWLTKHTRNLLKDRPIDNIGSALHSHGPIDPKTGEKTHPGPGDQLDSKAFTKKTNPKSTDSLRSPEELAKFKIDSAKIAAERKRLRDTKDPVLKRQSDLVKTIKDIGKYGK